MFYVKNIFNKIVNENRKFKKHKRKIDTKNLKSKIHKIIHK